MGLSGSKTDSGQVPVGPIIIHVAGRLCNRQWPSIWNPASMAELHWAFTWRTIGSLTIMGSTKASLFGPATARDSAGFLE